MPKTHMLKTLPMYFIPIALGAKKAEIRKNDRDFKKGDFVLFEKYIPNLNIKKGYYAGSNILAEITDITRHTGICRGYVMFSFVLLENVKEELNIAGDEKALRLKYGDNVKRKS